MNTSGVEGEAIRATVLGGKLLQLIAQTRVHSGLLMSIGAALAMIHIKNALDGWWELAAIFSGGILGLFLLGFVSRRAGQRAGLGWSFPGAH